MIPELRRPGWPGRTFSGICAYLPWTMRRVSRNTALSLECAIPGLAGAVTDSGEMQEIMSDLGKPLHWQNPLDWFTQAAHVTSVTCSKLVSILHYLFAPAFMKVQHQ